MTDTPQMDTTLDDREIIFVADDFGMNHEINHAILNAHLHGALHAACLMVGQPGTAEAIEMSRAHPTLQIGWHLHLNDSQPLTVSDWPWRSSPARAGLAMTFLPGARRLASAEIVAQWQALRATGLPVRFVNGHHHIHWVPFVRRKLFALLSNDPNFAGWLRWGTPKFFAPAPAERWYSLADRLLLNPPRKMATIRLSNSLWGLDRTFHMNADEIKQQLPELDKGIHEFMFHPRSTDEQVDPDTRCLKSLRAADTG
jgi:predicted glycoside hydrolase/deacetylase ChbG (UPF0249 family)